MKISEFESQLNEWGYSRTPFLFMIDFEMQNAVSWKSDEVPAEVLFSINEYTMRYPTRTQLKFGFRSTRHPLLNINQNLMLLKTELNMEILTSLTSQ